MNSEKIKAGLIPANTVLFRGAGQKMSALSFLEMAGLKGCVFAPTKIIAGECLEVRCKLISLIGLGASVGLDVIVASGATGSYDTFLNAKAETMCHALSTLDYQFGLLHVKAVDDAGHDRELSLKVGLLEQIDRMVGQIIKRLWMTQTPDNPAPVLIVTSDHSTPVCYGDH